MNQSVYNIVLAGVGGQGINRLTKTIHEHCLEQNWHCVSAVYKGGAQRLGSVLSQIRIFTPGYPNAVLASSQILPGALNVLIGFELWETLRYLNLCNKGTTIIANDFIEFPPGNRKKGNYLIQPKKELLKTTENTVVKDFQELAKIYTGNPKNHGAFMLNEAIDLGVFPQNFKKIKI